MMNPTIASKVSILTSPANAVHVWIQTIFAFLLFSWICGETNGQSNLPMLTNTATVEDCFPDTAGYQRITVGPSGRQFQDLQQALNVSVPGTVIVLDAGAVFQGGFVLPAKPASDRWIILISSRMDLLPGQGRRIEPYAPTGQANYPEQRHAMAGIQTINLSGTPCFSTQAGSQRYRLVGLEVSAHPSVINQYGLINFGDATTAQNQISKVPQHLILDRCFVHGHDQATIMKYGVRMDCANGAVVDCHFSDFHSVGFDAQAISGINGPGPFKFINNYLEASGENILIGGVAASIPGLVPSDMEIRQNQFSKPLRWWTKDPSYAGKHWTVKNLFELKTGKRVLLEGNILEYCWADLPIGQSGYAILLTVRTENGGSPQADVSDITIQNNIIRHTGAGISISGSDDGKGIRSKRILISNNLLDDINGPRFGDQNIYGPNDGTAFHLGEPEDLTIDHNSIFQTGAVTWAYKKMNGFQFTNNLVSSFMSAGGYQGIYGPGVKQGDASFAMYFPDLSDASRRFHKNVLIGGDAAKYNNFKTLSQNYFPANAASVGFVDFPNGSIDFLNYRLAAASPYAGQASGGGDIGADLNALKKALENKRDCADFPVGSSDHPSDFKWEILPNPANGQVTLNCSDEGLKYYILSDSNGQRVRTGSFAGRFHEITIHSLAPGIYSLQLNVKESGQSRTKTLVILY